MADQERGRGRERREVERTPSEFGVMFKVKEPFEVRIQFGEKEMDAIAQDLGAGGMAMITNGDIPVGSRLHLKFSIFYEEAFSESERYRSFDLLAEVRYSVLVKGTDCRVGLKFIGISEPEKAFIANYVRLNRLRPSQER